MKDWLFRRKLYKEAGIKKEKPQKEGVKAKIHKFRVGLFRERWGKISLMFQSLKRIPFTVAFILMLLAMFFMWGYWNDIRSDRWTNTIRQYPELLVDSGEVFLTPVLGEKIGLSVMDLVIAEWNAKINGFFWMLMNAFIVLTFIDIWKNYNPRKPLSVPFRQQRHFKIR